MKLVRVISKLLIFCLVIFIITGTSLGSKTNSQTRMQVAQSYLNDLQNFQKRAENYKNGKNKYNL
jgi:hypothetical protein